VEVVEHQMQEQPLVVALEVEVEMPETNKQVGQAIHLRPVQMAVMAHLLLRVKEMMVEMAQHPPRIGLEEVEVVLVRQEQILIIQAHLPMAALEEMVNHLQ
tara:strand:- start:266 stop:568 length:303 start_codon:yes stop_codon:yes gene_type:complete